MSIVAQTRYKEDYVRTFELMKSVLRQGTRSDVQDRGGSLVFNVAGTGGRTTTTRGPNGDIVPADDSQIQITLSFKEDIDYKKYTDFDVFKAQSDQIKLMRENSIGVINRKIDLRIIAALETGTVTLGAVGAMSKTVANKIATILGNAHAGEDDTGLLFCAVSKAAWAYLTDVTSFANADYINFGPRMPVVEGIPNIGRWKHWMGINWSAHSGLTGHGTSACTCLAWHRDSIGYAESTRGINAVIGYNEDQDYHFARATIYHDAVKLQNAGIVKFTHDDSGLSA